MDPEIKAQLRIEFPDGEAWAWRRFWADRPIFWNHRRERLTELSDHQILIALCWANYFAIQFGAKLKLYFSERELWNHYFGREKSVPKAI